MKTIYQITNSRLIESDNLEQSVWIDLLSPTREEEITFEKFLGIGLPTREDMEEIEISSRLYYENGAIFMTVQLPAGTEADSSHTGPVTFVIVENRLVTIRYHDPSVFSAFPARAARTEIAGEDGETVFLAFLEVVVDRLADIIERAGSTVAPISHSIFQGADPKTPHLRNYRSFLEVIGRTGDLISDIQDSLMTLDRAIGFYAQHIVRREGTESQRGRIKTLTRDLHSIGDHASFLEGKITFLLDATLGMLSIEQNSIIKIFSVAAVVFLPPTLVASIYGMNFKLMPELEWPLGYPFAVVLMIASALLPFWFFKRQGWL